MYRQFALPYERQLIEAMKQAGNAYPTLHICGKTTNIWSDMADTGAPILSLDNIVDLEAAKHEVGHRVVLMGNVKPTATMLQGTPADVDADVKECLAKAGDSPKGYLMALGCGLPLNTPPENIIALVEANRKYGQRAVLQG
jgi:uroporphyrinogen decarboxylase